MELGTHYPHYPIVYLLTFNFKNASMERGFQWRRAPGEGGGFQKRKHLFACYQPPPKLELFCLVCSRSNDFHDSGAATVGFILFFLLISFCLLLFFCCSYR